MDRIVEVTINGQLRYLNYSIAVMFEVNEKYGGLNGLLEAMSGPEKDSFKTIQWLTIACANDGELCRRAQGYDQVPFLTPKDVSLRMSPKEYEQLQAALSKCITEGYRREVEDKEDIDLGLQELQEKK